MQWKLSCYQLKIEGNNYKIFMQASSQPQRKKPILDTQKIKREKKVNHYKKHHKAKEDSKRGRNGQNNWKVNRKQ